MPGKVILAFEKGDFGPSSELEITERTALVIGVDKDCSLRLNDLTEGYVVSRTHCLLDINPPEITIRDYGSRNGTYLNEECIGKRPDGMSADEGRKLTFPFHTLKDGDSIRLASGNRMAKIKVRIEYPRVCPSCGASVQFGKGFCNSCLDKAKEHAARAYHAKPSADEANLMNPYFKQFYDTPQLANYRFLTAVGEGSFGTVHKAEHKPTGKTVAVKFVVPSTPTTRKSVARVEREMLIWGALKHPNIIEFREGFCIDGVFAMVAEYAAKGTLYDSLHYYTGPLQPHTAMLLFMPVIKALEYAHQAVLPKNLLKDDTYTTATGAVHRDIKPNNLLLDEHDNLKIADFGMAKAFELSGLSGLSRSVNEENVGTYQFMPRQQALETRDVGQAADVWAIAATLYYALTLECPRDFSLFANPELAVLESVARPIRSVNPSIPIRLAEAIDEALIDKPDIKVTTIREFRERLERAL